MKKYGNALAIRFRSKRGMASALIILLLVLLIFFGVLSLVTSAADLRLSQRRADWNKQFYQADAVAVAMLTALDRFCLTLDGTDDAGRLAEWLAERPDVHDWTLEPAAAGDGRLNLSALVAADASQGQGIAIRLAIRTGPAAGDQRIIIERWSQWQPEFEYGQSGGGLWKG